MVKVIGWILQICLKNWENKESKQQASPDMKPSAFPGDANANTIVPKSASRGFPSACRIQKHNQAESHCTDTETAHFV